MINGLKKLLSIIGYVNKTLFNRRYWRIAQVIRLPI
jgi:hypothetical protein